MKTKHEQTIEGHVDSNVAVALDQVDAYGGREGAFNAFSQNTIDSVREDGYSGEDALDAAMWFAKKFNEQSGTQF